jgi:hypothetical protein
MGTGMGCFSALTSCCNRTDTLGQRYNNGYNTTQKILELKLYRFFINNLSNLMMISNSVEIKEFYFIKKSWIKSWYKYTCYEKIRPLLIKNEINNEIDFNKIILDHKKEINFEGFVEKNKPPPLQFFQINNLNTNIRENFYIFDSNILKKFIEIYDISDDIDNKDSFSLKGEIGKGRIVFDVEEYILIMALDNNWEIKQMMIIFWNAAEHKQFLKNIQGRALSYISRELKKKIEKNKMISYQKDEIIVYDDRDFIKNEYTNCNEIKNRNTLDDNLVNIKLCPKNILNESSDKFGLKEIKQKI